MSDETGDRVVLLTVHTAYVVRCCCICARRPRCLCGVMLSGTRFELRVDDLEVGCCRIGHVGLQTVVVLSMNCWLV